MTVSVKAQVQQVVASILRIDAGVVGEHGSPATIPTWDSLHHMKLVMALEERFGLVFTENQIVQMLSVSKIVAVVERLVTDSSDARV